MMAGCWPRALHSRECGAGRLSIRVPMPNAGVLILEEPLTAGALPGGVLRHVEGRIHYLDLGGLHARSLADFGGSAALLGGITKLYASGSGLQSLEGVQGLASVRFLYLDHNQFGEAELLRLPELLPAGVRLEALDLSGNPGCTPEVERRLQHSTLLAGVEFFNGRRLRLHR